MDGGLRGAGKGVEAKAGSNAGKFSGQPTGRLGEAHTEPTVSVVIVADGENGAESGLWRRTYEALRREPWDDWTCLVVVADDTRVGPDAGVGAAPNDISQPVFRLEPRLETVPFGPTDLAARRNRGVQGSRGRYILVLNAGDVLIPGFLEQAVEVLNAQPAVDFVYSDLVTSGMSPAQQPGASLGPFALGTLVKRAVSPEAVLYRRGLWEANGGYTLTLGCHVDRDYWIGALKRGCHGHHLPGPGLVTTDPSPNATDGSRSQTLDQRHANSSGKNSGKNSAQTSGHSSGPSAGQTVQGQRRDRQLRKVWRARVARRHPGLFPSGVERRGGRMQKSLSERPGDDVENVSHPGLQDGAYASSRPLVSVIMSTIGRRPALFRRAVESVLTQTMGDLELIIVNDAGPPVAPTLDGLRYSERLVFLRLPRRRGLAAGRNAGLALARGKYIAYLDDDDVFYPEHLQVLTGAAQDGGHRLVYSNAYRATVRSGHASGEGGLDLVCRELVCAEPYSRGALLHHNIAPVLSFLHERTLLDEVGVFDESLGVTEDWDLWLRMSAVSPPYHVSQITAEYTWRVNTVNTKPIGTRARASRKADDAQGMTGQRQALFPITQRMLGRKYNTPITAAGLAEVFLAEQRLWILGSRFQWHELPLVRQALEDWHAVEPGPVLKSDIALLGYLEGQRAQAIDTWTAILEETHPASVADLVRSRLAAAWIVDGALEKAERCLNLVTPGTDSPSSLLLGDVAVGRGQWGRARALYESLAPGRLRGVARQRLDNLDLWVEVPGESTGSAAPAA